jgi:transcriptional regulator with AAA-type ATPase domain
VLLEGEAGSGRTTLARAVHQARTPADHLRVLDLAEPRRLPDVAEELCTGGTLVLAHVDRLGPDDVSALAEVLERHRAAAAAHGTWVAATITRPGPDRPVDLAPLVSLFTRTVEVPPLRHHLDDIAELVPFLLARISRGGALSCSPAVLRVLMRNRWPGNIEQLVQVLRSVVARRRTGVIEPGDLPPACRATTRRVLTPLEAIECDAIVEALLDTDGNKTEAARQLGMSRATIYRKIRDYGLSLPAEATEAGA